MSTARISLLSGGQRQRISLARAFLKDAPILILDEPTSAVDTQTEAQMMETTAELIRGRTTFMIAHRLSTVRDCDLVLQLSTQPEAFGRTVIEALACGRPVACE